MDAKDLEKIEYWHEAYRFASTAELRSIARQNLYSAIGSNLTDIIKAVRASLQPVT